MIVLSVFVVTARQNALQQYAAIQTVKTLFISGDSVVLYAPWQTLPLLDTRMQVIPRKSKKVENKRKTKIVSRFFSWEYIHICTDSPHMD